MSADGSGQTPVPNSTTVDLWPDWSPNGKRLTFITGRDGKPGLAVMNTDGRNFTRLANVGVQGTPQWSPDGRRIVFSSDRDGNWKIYVINADGTELTRLTNRATEEDVQPTWSPDGAWIAFVSRPNGTA